MKRGSKQRVHEPELSEGAWGERLANERAAGFETAIRSVGHALGTPINVILGYIELAEGDPAKLAPKHLETIRAQGRAMAACLGRVSEFARAARRSGDAPVAPAQQILAAAAALAPAGGEGIELVGEDGLSLPIEPFVPWTAAFLAGLRGVSNEGSSISVELRRGSTEGSVELEARMRSNRFAPTAKVPLKSLLSEPWLHSVDGISAEAQLALGACLTTARAGGGNVHVEAGEENDGIRIRVELPAGGG